MLELKIQPNPSVVISKKRRIKTTQSSDRGLIFTAKCPNEEFVEYESLEEERFVLLLDHCPSCIKLESQPLEIPNPKTGHFLYPDFYAQYIDGTQIIYEIKLESYLESLKDDVKEAQDFQNKIDEEREFCKKLGFQFQIITDKEIRTERFLQCLFFYEK
jgi:hypothetical protein